MRQAFCVAAYASKFNEQSWKLKIKKFALRTLSYKYCVVYMV